MSNERIAFIRLHQKKVGTRAEEHGPYTLYINAMTIEAVTETEYDNTMVYANHMDFLVQESVEEVMDLIGEVLND